MAETSRVLFLFPRRETVGRAVAIMAVSSRPRRNIRFLRANPPTKKGRDIPVAALLHVTEPGKAYEPSFIRLIFLRSFGSR